MGYGVLFATLVSISNFVFANDHCTSQTQRPEPIIRQSESSFGQEIEDISALFERYVVSGQRLEYRGFMESGKFLVPHMASNETAKPVKEIVEWPLHLPQAIAIHLEKAFEKGYANFPIMADMGHGHFYIPSEDYKALRNRPYKEVIHAVLHHPRLRILYHTAEHLAYVSDQQTIVPRYEFLRAHRNIVGSIDAPEDIQIVSEPSINNTVGGLPGWSGFGSFYLHVSGRGCFPFNYKGRPLKLDLGFMGPSYVPSESDHCTDGNSTLCR
ncbi:MAG: hypothetical protein K2Q26_15725 [Bdellovibrionales bacterium]|nr:hypothetical protein [Bdellovibrionales bacterium]